MKYIQEALALKKAAQELAGKQASGLEMLAFAEAVDEYEAAVCGKAWAEAGAAKSMYEEGLLAVRNATAQVVARYIENVAELELQIKELRAAGCSAMDALVMPNV